MKVRQRRPNRHPGGAARTPARSTIRDVARTAGVSTATISRFFNQPEKLSAKTWSRVQSAINLHHYVADGQAGGLASRRSRTLGLIIPTITNSIYAASTQAIQQTAQREGYTVLVGVSEFSPRLEATLVHRLLERRVEGLILTGAERNPELYEKISRNHVPFVVTWKSTRRTDLPSISFDNYKAARGAVDHLVALGHRRIGMICGRTEVNDRAFDRRRAFEDTLATYGLEVDPALIFERSFEFVEGRAAMHAMLACRPRPTAVFCANDIQAIGALYECRDAGIDIPRDMSIVGFDDLPIASYITPPLTTIRVPADEMGVRAARAIIGTIEQGSDVTPCELSTDLVVRGTTAPRRDRSG